MRYFLIIALTFLNGFVYAEEQWRLQTDGFGPIRVGMTANEVKRSVRFVFDLDDAANESCYYLHSKKYLPGVGIMLERGRVARIDINERRYASVRGVRVGDTHKSVVSKYGADLTDTPEHYEGPIWRDLTALSKSKKLGIRYVTDGKHVKGFTGGTAQAIGYVEGCA